MVAVVSFCFGGSLIGASFASGTGEGDIAAVLGEIATFVGCGGSFSVILMEGSALVMILINNGT